MNLKESFKKKLEDKELLENFRHKAAKSIFIFTAFLFFALFFLAGAGYYKDLSLMLLSSFYVLLIISLDFYLFFLIKSFKFKNIIFYTISITCLVISILFLYVII